MFKGQLLPNQAAAGEANLVLSPLEPGKHMRQPCVKLALPHQSATQVSFHNAWCQGQLRLGDVRADRLQQLKEDQAYLATNLPSIKRSQVLMTQIVLTRTIRVVAESYCL